MGRGQGWLLPGRSRDAAPAVMQKGICGQSLARWGWFRPAREEEDRLAVSSQVGSVLPVTASRRPEYLALLGPWRRGRGRGEHAGGISPDRSGWKKGRRIRVLDREGVGQDCLLYAFRDRGLGGMGAGETAPHSRATPPPARRQLGPREGGISRPPGRAVASSTVFTGSGEGGHKACLGSPAPACWLPLRTTPTQGFPGAGPPTPRGWPGRDALSPAIFSAVLSYGSVTAARLLVGVSFCAEWAGLLGSRGQNMSPFPHAFKERFSPPSSPWP